jgi:hypothetical protein
MCLRNQSCADPSGCAVEGVALLVGIVVSIPAAGMDSSLLRSAVFCQGSLHGADHSFREVLPSVVYLSVIGKHR